MIALVLLSLVSALALRVAVDATLAAGARRRVAAASPVWRAPAVVDRLVARAMGPRRARHVERTLPDALDAITRSLRSGGSLRQAVEEAASAVQGPLRDDLAVVIRDVQDGDALTAALARWADSRPLPGVRLATAALSLGADTGGASAQAIDGVAATLRTNLGIAGEVRALSSQARLSALVIALAPIAFAFLAATSDGTTATFLLGTPLGWLCLGLGLGLDALGWLWMRRLTAVVA